MTYLPSLSEALDWCAKAGVDKTFGKSRISPHQLIPYANSRHEGTEQLRSIKKIIVHHSGFTCGNVPFFRWYHRAVNGWDDIGYHLVVGNGKHNFSVLGGVELGRPLNLMGAHCSGHNQDSIGICLIDNENHFHKVSPSNVELHALENALLYLIDKADLGCKIWRHSDFNSLKSCPGAAVPVEALSEKVNRRKKGIRQGESAALTLDLRHSFQDKTVDYNCPEQVIGQMAEQGITRIVYPYHWGKKPWEDFKIARRWIETAHQNNMDVLLYTGPFGTELHEFLDKVPESSSWLQRKLDGSPASYDSKGYLQMFCPSSPYLSDYRLPVIKEFIRETGCDGIFFDIPWVISDACFCDKCKARKQMNGDDLLKPKERLVREALSEAVLALRDEFPELWLTANVAAPAIWETEKIGATPLSLSGLFDELIVEWTPSKETEVESIKKSILHVRSLAPTNRISHAWIPEKANFLKELLYEMQIKSQVGRWINTSQWSKVGSLISH